MTGTTVKLITPGELLIVRRATGPAPGLQLNVSVALPDPSLAANEMVRGFIVHVTFGVVGVALGRITVLYATPSAEATASVTMTWGKYLVNGSLKTTSLRGSSI